MANSVRVNKQRLCKPILSIWVLLACASLNCSSAEQATTQPHLQPSTTATTSTCPADARDGRDLALRVLEQLEAAGKTYPTIRAELLYEVSNPTLGDRELREGWVAFQTGTKDRPGRFRVHFETKKQGGGRKIRYRMDYAFDGKWLTQKNYKTRQIIRYQVAAEGERIEPLRLGQGPFPVPFGQRKDDVLEYFHAQARPAGPGEPAGTLCLELTARKQYRRKLGFARLQTWVDPKTHLPVKIVSLDTSKNVTTVEFRDIRTNPKLADAIFSLPRPLGWTVTVKRLYD